MFTRVISQDFFYPVFLLILSCEQCRPLRVLCMYITNSSLSSLLSNLLLNHTHTPHPPKLDRSVIFLIHTALEIPVAIQGVWSPSSLPFLELNNTAVVILKVSFVCDLRECFLYYFIILLELTLFIRYYKIAICVVSSSVLYYCCVMLWTSGYVFFFSFFQICDLFFYSIHSLHSLCRVFILSIISKLNSVNLFFFYIQNSFLENVLLL